ncbi:MAG TPA: capsular biosynthesis protein [Planctomycetaceae bacterium]|nr:capsular biosynthesis protein [Planctomycetaceae bacterium]
MTTQVLITGARGFLGRNLATHLSRRKDVRLLLFDRDDAEPTLVEAVSEADVVFHLAGVNRPERVEQFEEGNAGFTTTLVDTIRASRRRPHVIFSSSIQAALDNPYGASKRRAEQILLGFADQTGTPVSIFRLKNVFGKWCRPNYNSVVATFCHNIANNLPIQISDPDAWVDLVYVDDVVEALVAEMDKQPVHGGVLVDLEAVRSHSIMLHDLAERIEYFRTMHETLSIPDLSERFNRQLCATYLSYVPADGWEYGAEIRRDDRGDLAELVKSPRFGQIFVSRTRPGVTRGNHYHDTKIEKFMVIAGQGTILFRRIDQAEVIEFPVRGADYRIVDIPPGYTHSITNTGTTEMITLFWASEPFDHDRPDTYFLPVVIEQHVG